MHHRLDRGIFFTYCVQGIYGNIHNYTCIEDSNVVKLCESSLKISKRLEIIFDGNNRHTLSSSSGRCNCFASTDHPNGTFLASVTDLRLYRPPDLYFNCSSVVLNVFGAAVQGCQTQSFRRRGVYSLDSSYLNVVTLDQLFLTGTNDIPSMVWETIKVTSSFKGESTDCEGYAEETSCIGNIQTSLNGDKAKISRLFAPWGSSEVAEIHIGYDSMDSNSVTVNCSAIVTVSDNSSSTTEVSTREASLLTRTTIQDHQATIMLNSLTTHIWSTCTEESPMVTVPARDTENEASTVSIVFYIALPVAGELILIVIVIITFLCIRMRRKQKQVLRRSVSKLNNTGNRHPPSPLKNTANLRKSVHNHDEIGESQSKGHNLLPNIKRDADKYDHITLETLPRKRIHDHDLMMQGVNIPPIESNYSYTTFEPYLEYIFNLCSYSHNNFDKTRTVGIQSENVNRHTKSRENNIVLESKPAKSNVNPTEGYELATNDNYSHILMQSRDDVLGRNNNYHPRENDYG